MKTINLKTNLTKKSQNKHQVVLLLSNAITPLPKGHHTKLMFIIFSSAEKQNQLSKSTL